jgi:glycosyltransferase involved in cell wall biosynthesis
MTDPPLVSVIVPAWNAQATLAETLQSVVSQTYPNMEIIIVDDGSNDGTAANATDFCASEPRARFIAKDNGGVASARNRGIEEALGEWVAPIDADDLWHPTKIAKQVAAALAAPERPGFVYCWYQSIDHDGRVLGSGPQWQIEGAAFRQLAYNNPVQNGSALLIRRDSALAVGGYDSSLRARGSEGCEDVMIQLRIARSYPIAVVPEHLVGYRKHPHSMSSNTSQIIRSWKMVYETLAADGVELPAEVIRWTDGFFNMALAEERAVMGQYREAFRHLFVGVARDPVRWLPYITYRLARTSARLLRGRRPRPESIHFGKVDPLAYIPGDPDELTGLARLLVPIDTERLSRLAMDETLLTGRGADRSAGCPAARS